MSSIGSFLILSKEVEVIEEHESGVLGERRERADKLKVRTSLQAFTLLDERCREVKLTHIGSDLASLVHQLVEVSHELVDLLQFEVLDVNSN